MKRLVGASLALLAWSFPALTRAEPARPQLAVGAVHSCAVHEQRLWCWGNNGNGQLGLGTTADVTRPTPVDALGADVTAVVAGSQHTCALKGDRSLWCWGSNFNGELGDGSQSNRASPVAVTALGTDVTAVAAGWSHTCAVGADGSAWCWGNNDSGRLGDGTTQRRVSPTRVIDRGVAQVAVGVAHTCALHTDGTLSCWGFNGLGAVGNGTTQDRSLPTPVTSLGNDVVEVATGAHTCARTGDGRLWCWGWNLYGQLGDNSNFNRSSPYEVGTLLTGITAVSAGWRHTCATKGGQLRCWGYNARGTVGDGTLFHRAIPVLTTLGETAFEVAAGDDHTCAWGTSGLWCTGANQYGQLGLGDLQDRRALARVTFTPPAVAVNAPAGGLVVTALLALVLGGVGARRRRAVS